MIEAEWRGGESSLFRAGTTLVNARWKIARWALTGVVLGVLWGLTRPAVYRASASFLPQGSDASRSGLASLAGQLGVALPTMGSGQSFTPELYARLLRSRFILVRIVSDSFAVTPNATAPRRSFYDIFDIRSSSPALGKETALKRLGDIVNASVSKTTGVVEISAVTKWPTVSLGIVTSLLDAINDFNLRTRQGQAGAERRFVQGRLALADSNLRAAELQLEGFLEANRQLGSAPQLSFQRERLQREVMLRQQVFTSLTQSFEEVRLREVRDTPVITTVEPPMVPAVPEPRGRLNRVVIGLILGLIFGLLAAFGEDALRRQRVGNPDAAVFAKTIGELKGEMMSGLRRARKES